MWILNSFGLLGELPACCELQSFVLILWFRWTSLYRPVLNFFRALVQPEYSAVTDVYVLMFLADTVDFIIIVFGFWAFGVKLLALMMDNREMFCVWCLWS